ncbi:MAG: ferredoxin--NADP reductase [Rhizobiales bacterium]|nr:ferredoxin--NADP reductase [Hyphomicrobiales bacterium]
MLNVALKDIANVSQASAFEVPKGVYDLPVLDVKHYTDRLFSFRLARPDGFRFRSGEFVMIGLPGLKPVWRAYSLASPNWEEHIEFFSIKVPGGPLTTELQLIEPGDSVWMRTKSTGTLVHDALLPGKRLFLLSTGTGIAPFASVIRDPETYEKFEQVVLVHTTREKAELQYGYDLIAGINESALLSELVGGKLVHYATTTQEQSQRMGRITDLIRSGKFFSDIGAEGFNPDFDRIMICGSMAMLKEVAEIAENAGFEEGSNAKPGAYVIEKAFVG